MIEQSEDILERGFIGLVGDGMWAEVIYNPIPFYSIGHWDGGCGGVAELEV